jgi:hypothetical protein
MTWHLNSFQRVAIELLGGRIPINRIRSRYRELVRREECHRAKRRHAPRKHQRHQPPQRLYGEVNAVDVIDTASEESNVEDVTEFHGPETSEAIGTEGIREGCIVFIPYHKCSRVCPIKGPSHTCRKSKHQGEGHSFVVTGFENRDNKDCVTGHTCTSLRGREHVTQEELNFRFLRLEGGRSRFRLAETIPELFIEGDYKMKVETYVEKNDRKSFPIDQLGKNKHVIHKLEPGKHISETPGLEARSLDLLKRAYNDCLRGEQYA